MPDNDELVHRVSIRHAFVAPRVGDGSLLSCMYEQHGKLRQFLTSALGKRHLALNRAAGWITCLIAEARL